MLPYAAMQWLLQFPHLIFKALSVISPTLFICTVSALLPASLYLARKYLHIHMMRNLKSMLSVLIVSVLINMRNALSEMDIQ